MKKQSLTMEHDGLTLTAELYGEDTAPLVILLHGFPDTPHSWDKLLPELVSAGYRVLTPWLRGYTLGSARRDAAYDLLSVASDIHAWRQLLNAEQAHLVGHDWGAAISNVLAGQQNGAEAHWQTVSMLAVPAMPNKTQWRSLLPQLPKQLLYSAYMPVMQLSASHRFLSRNKAAYVRHLWQRWSPGWDFSEAEFSFAQQLFSEPLLAWASTRYYRNLFRWHDPRVRQAFGLMQQPFSMPTLILTGSKDGCMHKDTHRIIAETASARGPLQLQQLADCGHFLQAERPQVVAAALLDHFKQSPITSSRAQ